MTSCVLEVDVRRAPEFFERVSLFLREIFLLITEDFVYDNGVGRLLLKMACFCDGALRLGIVNFYLLSLVYGLQLSLIRRRSCSLHLLISLGIWWL